MKYLCFIWVCTLIEHHRAFSESTKCFPSSFENFGDSLGCDQVRRFLMNRLLFYMILIGSNWLLCLLYLRRLHITLAHIRLNDRYKDLTFHYTGLIIKTPSSSYNKIYTGRLMLFESYKLTKMNMYTLFTISPYSCCLHEIHPINWVRIHILK